MTRSVGLRIDTRPAALDAALVALGLAASASEGDLWVVEAGKEGAPGDAVRWLAVYDPPDATAAFAGLGAYWADAVARDAPVGEWVARLRMLGDRRDAVQSARQTLGWIAHDLNNPLAALRILAEVAAMDVQDPERQRDLADMIEAVDAASVLVEVLHAAARGADSGDVLFQSQNHARTDRVTLARNVLARPCFAPHVAWIDNGPWGPDDGAVLHSAALRSAFTLLFWNARRLTAEGERFQVRWESPRRLCVTSRGIEVHKADAALLLEVGGALSLRERWVPVSPVGLAVVAASFQDSGAVFTARSVEGGVEVQVVWSV